ncbi:hypothetical protein BC833DRAFT_662179 [Globomyces pollinis-pini]|nr:hypothetical protein BC833DRAFT_662179 [Globomyces pollinis-pini]KAJ2995945.1 hypothetical protein HDV02_000296 [Globomyces sp. JEL0801]
MPSPLPASAKLYFPNFIVKYCRSNLPPHQAVFYCPPQLNKFDIKQYLQKLYNLNITDVRTMNYQRIHKQPYQFKQRNAIPAYKKVIITMTEDYIFPDAPSVQNNNAVRIPPQVSSGRNSGNAFRSKIQQQYEERPDSA